MINYTANVFDGYGKKHTKVGTYGDVCQFVFNELLDDPLATYDIWDDDGVFLDYGFDTVINNIDDCKIERCPDNSIIVDDRWHIYGDYGVVYDEYVGEDYDEISDIPQWVFDIRDVYTGKWQ